MEFVPPPPASLPPLVPTDTPWPAEIVTAHERLTSMFSSARNALNLDESDPIKLRFHLDRASTIMVSIIDALATQNVATLPDQYIISLAQDVGSLVVHLRHALDGAEVRYVYHAINISPNLLSEKVTTQRFQKSKP